MLVRTLSIIIASAFCSLAVANQKINQFIHTMQARYHYNGTQLHKLLDQLKPNKKVISWITHPYESKPWHQYHHHFLTQKRIDEGVLFWSKNKKVLRVAQQKYGVDPSVIVAIIGMESEYGQHLAHFGVFNALATLAFYYPKRSHFFSSELRQFLLMTRKDKLTPLSVRGSYAGAMGLPQFMPSSYLKYAVSYSGHYPVDITHNRADAIVSVANFLKAHGWQRHAQIAKRVNNNKIGQAHIVSMQDQTQTKAWRTYKNFKAIMSYNPRIPYATAVYQLSLAIRKRHQLCELKTCLLS